MKYWIDAYNLIGKMSEIDLSDPSKEQRLLQTLQQKRLLSKDKFLLVFDGKQPLPGFGQKEVVDNITLYFTPSDQTADAYLIEKIERIQNKSTVRIVSSDREIIEAAKKARIDIWLSELFFEKYQRLHPTSQEVKDPIVTDDEVSYWLDQFE